MSQPWRASNGPCQASGLTGPPPREALPHCHAELRVCRAHRLPSSPPHTGDTGGRGRFRCVRVTARRIGGQLGLWASIPRPQTPFPCLGSVGFFLERSRTGSFFSSTMNGHSEGDTAVGGLENEGAFAPLRMSLNGTNAAPAGSIGTAFRTRRPTGLPSSTTCRQSLRIADTSHDPARP